MLPNLPKIQILFYQKSPKQDFIKRTLASVVVSGLVLGLITLQAGNADDYIAAAMTIDYAATHIGLENRKFSNNKVIAALFLCLGIHVLSGLEAVRAKIRLKAEIYLL